MILVSEMSTPRNLKNGLPQGSVPAPLTFSLLITNSQQNIHKVCLHRVHGAKRTNKIYRRSRRNSIERSRSSEKLLLKIKYNLITCYSTIKDIQNIKL